MDRDRSRLCWIAPAEVNGAGFKVKDYWPVRVPVLP